MPDAALSHLPFIHNVRTPSRAIVFVYLFMAIGIGRAAALALQHWQRPVARWGMIAAAALIVLDFFPAHRLPMTLPMTPVTCSSGLAVIRDDPEKGFGVLDLPSGKDNFYMNNFYMLQQAACHFRPIAQGITARNVVVSLRDDLESRDLRAQQRQLTAAKIKYIVIHGNPGGTPIDQYPLTYATVYDGPDLMVLRVY